MDLVNSGDDPVLLAQATQVLDWEQPALVPASDPNGRLRHQVGREKLVMKKFPHIRTALVQLSGLDVLGRLHERDFLACINGEADIAGDVLADFFAYAEETEDLDRIPLEFGVVLMRMNVEEKQGKERQGLSMSQGPAGVTTAFSGDGEKISSIHILKDPHMNSPRNHRSQEQGVRHPRL